MAFFAAFVTFYEIVWEIFLILHYNLGFTFA